MPALGEERSPLDRLVHEPARLAILTALAACQTADFVFLQSVTGLTSGNLSGHLAGLERAALVQIEKSFKGKMPHTAVRVTREGRDRIRQHWHRLEQLRQAARGKKTPRRQPVTE